MSDFTDFVYLELPKRPVTIKGNTEATGDPNLSLIAKVQNAPTGTLYLQDDVIPKIYWYRSSSEANSWKKFGSGAAEAFEDDFLISDWVAGAGIWYIEFEHGLDTLNTNVIVREGTGVVFVDTITINTNITRIQIPADFRFDGSIKIT